MYNVPCMLIKVIPLMKKLLYATFVLLTITLPTTHAYIFGEKNSKPAEVEDLTLDQDLPEKIDSPNREYAWFWQRTEPKKNQASTASKSKTPASLPSPRFISTPHIALLLPLSGQYESAALAIREGFIGAYYLEQQRDPNTAMDIRIYDTKADKNVPRAYEDAVQQGANVIVGPLSKPGLEALLDSEKIDNNIPMISLNTLETRNRLPRYLYPFALSPEDEAMRLAEQAIHDGHHTAVGLVQDDSYGGRAFRAFKRRFEQLGGSVKDIIYFDPNRALEDPVRYILKIDSNASSDNPPRPRQSMDLIFLVAKPQQARQIPPLLKFYFAQNTPIYAMSSVYSGIPNPGLDNDLNGIIFCDSPWIIDTAQRDPALVTMSSQLHTPATQDRLFAFGVDAFLVARQMSHLSSVSELRVNGVTGELSMDKSGFIVRNVPCARFSLGVPHVL